jgi:hypothetical protein
MCGGGWEGANVDPTTVEAGVEKEWAHGVDSTAVGEAVGVDPSMIGEVPAWTRRRWWCAVRR